MAERSGVRPARASGLICPVLPAACHFLLSRPYLEPLTAARQANRGCWALANSRPLLPGVGPPPRRKKLEASL